MGGRERRTEDRGEEATSTDQQQNQPKNGRNEMARVSGERKTNRSSTKLTRNYPTKMTTDGVEEVQIEPKGLLGLLGVPPGARAIVVFAHGSGSGRLSPRNTRVASELRRAGLATFLLDLLTPEEEADRRNVFDIPLLAKRLQLASEWLRSRPNTATLSQGYFGASTGAGAALTAAAALTDTSTPIRAVVSRGGRPDLAMNVLDRVCAPTLLLVGGLDGQVIGMNERALNALVNCKQKKLHIVPGATHLFEEPGTMEEVVRLAKKWFLEYLHE
ncbi:hypothetical protein niasHS_007195 [Heterodera schachtii]|uniref:Uncharacterized protein n=1 Tax=Heterodera schachtii TaxID=97005 RepID=A0ABD2JJS3_HETSC